MTNLLLCKCLITANWSMVHIIEGTLAFNMCFVQKPVQWMEGESTKQEGRKEMFYLMMHSTHFIYGYMASDTW